MTMTTATSAIIYDENGRMVEFINTEPETLEEEMERKAYERDKQLNPHLYENL